MFGLIHAACSDALQARDEKKLSELRELGRQMREERMVYFAYPEDDEVAEDSTR
jgi:hypothetical protein